MYSKLNYFRLENFNDCGFSGIFSNILFSLHIKFVWEIIQYKINIILLKLLLTIFPSLNQILILRDNCFLWVPSTTTKKHFLSFIPSTRGLLRAHPPHIYYIYSFQENAQAVFEKIPIFYMYLYRANEPDNISFTSINIILRIPN